MASMSVASLDRSSILAAKQTQADQTPATDQSPRALRRDAATSEVTAMSEASCGRRHHRRLARSLRSRLAQDRAKPNPPTQVPPPSEAACPTPTPPTRSAFDALEAQGGDKQVPHRAAQASALRVTTGVEKH